jgi:hypothetical protein
VWAQEMVSFIFSARGAGGQALREHLDELTPGVVATALGRLQRLSRVPVSHPLRVPVMDALEAHVLGAATRYSVMQLGTVLHALARLRPTSPAFHAAATAISNKRWPPGDRRVSTPPPGLSSRARCASHMRAETRKELQR